MPTLSPAQANAVRWLLGLPAHAPARQTWDSLTRAGIVVSSGGDTRRRVHPEDRAALCGPGGLTDAERAVVEARLASWRQWDLEEAAANQEAAACRRLVEGLPQRLRHRVYSSRLTLDNLDIAARFSAASLDDDASRARERAARATLDAELHEADAAALRELAAAARATPRPTVTP